jgi:DNA-directed RNA polymerase sigma subunit (sigma70/sigma32)
MCLVPPQDPARMAGAILLQDDLNNVLLTLTDREAGILRMRFGLDDGVEKTLEEVGRAFNVSFARGLARGLLACYPCCGMPLSCVGI